MPEFYRLGMPKEEINKTLLTAVLEAKPVVAGNFAAFTKDGQIVDSQKTAADFAPSGYGLGLLNGRSIPDNDFNNALQNGWYTCVGEEAHSPDLGNPKYTSGAVLFVKSGRIDWTKEQTLHLGVAGLQGLMLRRYFHNARETWMPWEWINPPMNPGTEYRTIERWGSNPVYAKRIACGKGPGLDAQISIAHNISDIGYIIGYSGCMTIDGEQAVTFPYVKPGGIRADLMVDQSNIWIVSENYDFSGYTDTQAWLKYTKTTD